MVDEVLNMSVLALNTNQCKLKDLCFKTATNHILTVATNLKNERNRK
jgi:hypothetical protein